MKVQNRKVSFLLLAIIYAAAAGLGVACYVFISVPDEMFWLRLMIADIISTVFVYLFSLIFNNASVYDPYWSVQPIVIVIAFSVRSELSVAAVLMIIAVLIWGVRLTANWAYTFCGLTHEDWRYASYKVRAGKLYPVINLFGFHLMPTMVVYSCILPAVYLLRAGNVGFNAGSIMFFALSLGATVLEGAADCYMHAFKKAGKQGFIREGVWKYSRHPNYLGEILMWWCVGFAVICVLPQVWYLLAGALINTLMFIFISVPLADTHQARKDGFPDYKLQTRMLLPFPKKQNKE